MRKILWMVGLFLNSFAFSQVSEEFNDGEFLHQPVWVGDTGRFFINSKLELQSKLFSKSDTAYLSTSNKNLLNTSWEFYLQLNMDPSTSNQVRIYLAFDRKELDSIGNGYFLQLGETGSSDSYDLYRKSGKSVSKIIDVLPKSRVLTDTLRAFFRIVHKINGYWELYSRTDTNVNWVLEGSAFDNTFSVSEYFGVSIKHTSTKSDRLIFDNIKIDTYELDTITEQIISKHDIIISEIMADPTPAVNLPEHEYIELYNTTKQSINLNNWIFQNGNTKIKLPNYFIAPFETLILCKSSDTSEYSQYGNVLGLSSWPSLLNNGSTLKIINEKGNIIDEVNYSINWYKESRKSDGGYSLEYDQNKKLCDGGYLWSASISEDGGTPGKHNSKWGNELEDLYVTQINILNDTSIYLKFNIQPDTSNLLDIENYAFNNSNLHIKKIKYLNSNTNELLISFSDKLKSKFAYEFKIENIRTCDNRKLNENIFILNFINNDDTSLIRINEIYADPFPSQGLAEAEYIELFNASANNVNLDAYTISIGTSKYYLPARIIKPGEYLLICSSNDTSEIKKYGVCIGINGLVSLSNTSATISLNNKVGRLIDRVSYKNTWYRDITKVDGGWSLELIDPFNRCNFINKWSSSIHSSGGTPGRQNSIADFYIDKRNLAVASFQNLNGYQFKIKMNKAVDGRYINPAQLYFVGAKNKLFFPQKMELDSPYYQIFTLTFNTALPIGKYNLVCQYIPSCSRADTNVIIPVNISSVINNTSYIHISEIMSDPSPSRGLAEAEYIELYNSSEQEIENTSLYITDKKDTVAVNIDSWAAKEYILISHKDFRKSWDADVHYIPLNKMLSLGNESDSIYLLDQNKNIIDYFKYSYLQLPKDKRDGGYSFSRIADTWDCKSEYTWQASANAIGGSPGKENESIDHYEFQNIQLTQSILRNEKLVECSFNPQLENSANIQVVDQNQKEIKFEFIGNGRLTLHLNEAITAGNTSEIFIKTNNCLGMNLDTSVIIYNKYIPLKNELLINEILFNPSPGGLDFIEIYNNSDATINISDILLTNTIDTFHLKNILKENSSFNLIHPGEYRVISVNKEAIKSQYYVKNNQYLIDVSKMISMPDDKGTIQLLNENYETIDYLVYNKDYHLKWLDETEGRSLERKRINTGNTFSENWSSATDDIGKASPTYKNSQATEEGESKATEFWLTKEILSPITISSDGQLELNYQIDEEANLVNVRVFTSRGNFISEIISKRSIRNNGLLVWDLSIDGEIIPMGSYILQVETYRENRARKSYKIPFAIHY